MLLKLIPVLAVIACFGNCQTFQHLGTPITNNPDEGILVQNETVANYTNIEGQIGTMIDKTIVIGGMEPNRYRVTTITIPVPAIGWNGSPAQLVSGHGCIEAKFLSYDDIKADSKIANESLVILADDRLDALSLLDSHVRRVLHDNQVTLGFLKRFKALDDDTRKMLHGEKIAFVENLQLPDTIDLITAVRSKQKFYAFLSIFSPFKNATTTYRGEGAEQPKVLVNLADLALVKADSKWDSFCSESRQKIALFSHNLVSDTFPTLPGVELPHFDDAKRFHFSGQSGSSLIAPYRFDKSKLNVADLANKAFVFAPCTLITLPFGEVPNFKITRGHLEQWEKDRKMQIPQDAVVLLNVGFWAKWESPEIYSDLFPSLEVDAVRWLVEQRHVSAIGLDSLSFDSKASINENKWPVHGYLAEKDVAAFVNLRFEETGNHFPEAGSRCLASFLNIQRGTASPLTLFGLPGYDLKEVVVPEKAQAEFRAPSMKEIESTDRWQLGAVIRHQALDCDCDIRPVSLDVYKSVAATSKEPLIGNEITLAVDPTKNRVTTLTQPGSTSVNTTEGCVEVIFIKEDDIRVIKKKLEDVRENMFLIFLAPNLLTLNDDDMIKVIGKKKVTIGFFDDITLTSDIRNKLLTNGIAFFENLQRPMDEKFEKLDENMIYYGFKFVFSPLGVETSLPASLNAMQPTRKINMADLVVFDTSNVKAMTYRCSKKAYAILSQKWGPAEQLPVFSGVKRPELVDNQAKLVFSDHFGTHLDLPYHFDTTSKFDATKVPARLDHPVCFQVFIPFNERPNFAISKADLLSWEANNSKIQENSLVLLNTGYAMRKWSAADQYVLNYPGLSLEAAQFLVEERKIAGVAIDSLLLDDYSMTSQLKFPTHSYLASKNVVALVNAGGQLDKFPPSDGICVMSYLRIENGTGAQVALFGLLPDLPQLAQETTQQPISKAIITTATDTALILLMAAFIVRLF